MSSPAGARAGDAPDAPYLGPLAGVDFRPVFIVGSARSGTTVLYQLLARTGRFNWISTYTLVNRDELLANHHQGRTTAAKEALAERLRQLGVTGARFDGVEVSPDFPEEYGFALADGSRQQLTPRTLPRFLELCRKVQVISGADRPLLLKNPWDSRRFLYVKQALPGSRFIFIHRNPADVVHSMRAGLRSLLGAHNAYHALLAPFYDRLMRSPWRLRLARMMFSARFGLGPRFVGWQVARTARYFVDNVGALPPADHLSVRYEDLCRDPGTVVNQILRFLGEAENHEVPYQQFIRPRPSGREANAREHAVLKRVELKPYLAFCGYEAE
jgi:Sulfotransferase family